MFLSLELMTLGFIRAASVLHLMSAHRGGCYPQLCAVERALDLLAVVSEWSYNSTVDGKVLVLNTPIA